MFSEKLKELRETKGYTQIQAAAIVGVSGPSYAAYENGKSKPSIDAMVKFAEHYGVSLDWLCGISSDSSLRNYGEIATCLHKIISTGLFKISFEELPSGAGREKFFSLWTNEIECYGDNDEDFVNAPSIFDSFLSDYRNLQSLVRKGTLSKEIFNSWLDSWLSKYGKTPILYDDEQDD